MSLSDLLLVHALLNKALLEKWDWIRRRSEERDRDNRYKKSSEFMALSFFYG